MRMPAEFERELRLMLQDVREKNHLHHLERPERQRVYAWLGPRYEPRTPDGDIGRRRRTRLDLLSAEKVLPLWDARFPRNDLPKRLLANVPSALDRVEGEHHLWLLLRRAQEQCEAMHASAGDGANLIGYAAIRVLDRACSDLDFDPQHFDPQLHDSDVIATYNDASFLAAAAASGGYPWRADSDSGRRLAFWEWWLQVAVPQAWASTAEMWVARRRGDGTAGESGETVPSAIKALP